MFSRLKNLFVVLIMMTVLTTGVTFALQNGVYSTNQVAAISDGQNNVLSQAIPLPVYVPPEKLSNPPAIIKSVYVTGYSAGSGSYLNYLSNIFRNTEINAVVVDIKGSSGYVSYASGAKDVRRYRLNNDSIKDIDELVRFFHNQNIYVIGRVAVFEDPVYSKVHPEFSVYNKAKTTDPANPTLWQDNNRLSWMDPASKDVWDYNVSLAKDVFYHGFDEVNFDYVRFPTDGNMENMGFPVYDGKTPKSQIIESFFQYVRSSLPNDKISADLFGLTTVNTDDMGIGQIIEDAFLNFDYVSPMVYPSHYAAGFIGFSNPAEHPYEVIKYSLDSALLRQKALALAPGIGRLRPWIQDFNMGATYSADMVKAEIKATQDALGNNFAGFMLWNPSNVYTQAALAKSN